MKRARTFQEIYDFCLLDRTYNAYFNIPDSFGCLSKREYRYYYANMCNRSVSRAGTFIYGQSMKQLERFLKGHKKGLRIHIDAETFEEVDYQTFKRATIYIVAHIERDGVRITFNHPFKSRYESDNVCFTARSHRHYDSQGLINEVRRYIDKNIWLPPGRYRDLQLEYKVPKEKFVDWYRQYKEKVHAQYESEYWEMYEKHHPTHSMCFEESYSLLAMSGAFFDFGADNEYEREEMAETFMRINNTVW